MRNIAAVLILAYLVLLTFFGPSLAPFPENFSESSMELKGERIYSPFGPNDRHPLGTDIWGYDMLTRILYGFRYTVGAVIALAGGRVLLGLLVGMALGLRSSGPGRTLPHAPVTVPAFIIVYFTVFRVSIGSPLSVGQLLVVQGSLIILVGLPGLIASFAEDTKELAAREFSQAAISVGAGKFRLLRYHIFPHMTGRTVRRFVDEAVSVLVLLGQLAMFNVFLGGTDVQLSPVIYLSRTNELAGMVGEYRNYLTSDQWLLLSPLAAYLSVLLAFLSLSWIVRSMTRLNRGKYL